MPRFSRKTRSRIHLIAGALVMLVLALGFNALLTSATLEKLYVETIVSKYNVAAKDLQRNLETALRFGKSLEKFIGIDRLIDNAQQHLGRKDITISITRPDGHIFYSSDPTLKGGQIPEAALGLPPGAQDLDGTHFVKYQGTYYQALPVRGGMNKEWAATVMLAFSEDQAQGLLTSILVKNIKVIGLIIFCGTALLTLLVYSLIPDTAEAGSLPRFKISAVFFSVIVLSQVIFTGFNIYEFKNHYLDMSREKNGMLSTLLKQDIEYLLAKGIKIRRMVKMDEKLGDIIAVSPELDAIIIADTHGRPLYIATKQGMQRHTRQPDLTGTQAISQESRGDADPDYSLSLDLISRAKDSPPEPVGRIGINISKSYLFKKLRDIALDSITVLAISIFFFVELLILELQLIEKQMSRSSMAPAATSFLSIRPVAFMFIFGVDTCISFLPLHMATLYNPADPIFGLSKDVIMGLPISMQMLFTSISLLISGAWCDKRGWHEPFLIGLFLSGSGFIYAWLAPNAIHFLFALGLVGMGYGLALMAAQGFIIAHTSTDNSAQGMAQLFAGVYAGSICGGAAGAMLADRIGYPPVFFVGGAILFLLIIYTLLMMKDEMHRPKPALPDQTGRPAGQFKARYIVQFLFNRKILSLILFYGLPWYIVLIGFMNYYSPIYLKSIGTTQSDIGRIFMIYGICLMYIAPLVSRFIGTAQNKKRFLVMGSFIGSLSIANFYFFKDVSGVTAITVSIFLLGLSACLIPVRSAYVLDFEVTQRLGGGKAIGILNAVLRLGQVSGPLLFGWLFLTMGSDQGIAATGIVYLLFTLIFVLVG